MTIQSTLEHGRRAAEARMLSTCKVTRDTGQTTTDHETGAIVKVVDTIYTGKCELVFPDAQARSGSIAGQTVAVQQPVLKVPVEGTAAIKPGDIAELTAHPLDPGMVGVKVRINGEHTRGYATARRFPVEAVS